MKTGPLTSPGQNLVNRPPGYLNAVDQPIAGRPVIDEPQVKIIEKLRCFQTEIVEIASAVHRGDIHNTDQVAFRIDMSANLAASSN